MCARDLKAVVSAHDGFWIGGAERRRAFDPRSETGFAQA
jgi:hypothetical protein